MYQIRLGKETSNNFTQKKFIMKKTTGILALTLMFIGCTSDNDMHYKNSDSKEVKAENQAGGIQNVNGNLPDTTNTINIGTHQPDALLKDSSK